MKRSGDTRPYIQITGSWSAYFGIRLVACVAERGEPREEREIAQQGLRRQMDFINALFSSRGNRTFALRYISQPDPRLLSAGGIEIVLLGKIEHKERSKASRGAADLCRETAGLLVAAMPNHLWQIISDQALFQRLFTPFDTSSVCEIRRREDAVSLATMRPRSVMGFGNDALVAKQRGKTADIYFVNQFLPRPSTMARLLRTMMLHRAPLMFQVSLKPVKLDTAEKRGLNDEITKCEQTLRGIVPEGSTDFDPVLHGFQAQLFHHGLVEQSLRLKDAPYLLQISVGSSSRIPLTLAEAVGIEITYPIWSRLASRGEAKDAAQLQGGGYDIAFPLDQAQTQLARSNVTRMEFNAWGLSLAPPGLKRIRQLVDAGEAACAFRVPIATTGGLDGVEVRASRFRAQPLELARVALRGGKAKILLGHNISLGTTQPVFIGERDRRQHTYVIGQTGTGKTSLLRTMILSDMDSGKGLAVLDPHGDLFRELLHRIPKHRRDDVIILDPTDRECAVGLNLLQCRDVDERHFVVREMRSIMERLLDDQYHHKAAEYTGPIFYQHMQMNMLLAMSDPENPGTLLEFYEIYQQKSYWKRWLPLKWSDAQLSRWVRNNLPSIDYLRRSGNNEVTMGEYLSSKFDDFIFDPRLRMIFGQKHSTIDLRQIMDEGKILLINLAKGELSESNSRFLGMALMAKIQAAAMSRSDMPSAKRRTFYLYVDEFQSLATQNFITLLSEGRKFGIALVLANQFLSQIKDERIMQSVTGNVGTHICFRVGREDAQLIEPQFAPYFDQFDLCNLPNWNACVRTTVDGRVVSPFTMETVVPTSSENLVRREEVLKHSRRYYSKPRSEIEKEIANSFTRPALSVDEVMTEVENRRLKTVLIEEEMSIITRFRSMIRGFPLMLVRGLQTARSVLSGDWPVVLFCNIDPPRPLRKKKPDGHSDLPREMRPFVEQSNESITLADYLVLAEAQPWSPIFVIPYRTNATKRLASAKIPPFPNVLAHPELTFNQLEDQAVEAKKFNPWLRQLLSACERPQNPRGSAGLRGAKSKATKSSIKRPRQSSATTQRLPSLPGKGNSDTRK